MVNMTVLVLVIRDLLRPAMFSAWPTEGRMELKMNCQMEPSTIPPIRLGTKKPARYTLRPRISLVTSREMRKATTLTAMTFSTVNSRVIRKECMKPLS